MQVKRVKRTIVQLIAALEKEVAEIDAEILLPSATRRSGEKKDSSPQFRAWSRSPRAPSWPNCRTSALPKGECPRIIFETAMKNWCLIFRGSLTAHS
jgi:hypothetical protein